MTHTEDGYLKGHLEGLLPAIDLDIDWERSNIKLAKERLTLLTKKKAEVVGAIKTLFAAEPRQWELLTDVPPSLEVRSQTGFTWKYFPESHDIPRVGKYRWNGTGQGMPNTGPFTEITKESK